MNSLNFRTDSYATLTPQSPAPPATPLAPVSPHHTYWRFFVYATLLIGLGSFFYFWMFGFSALSGSLYVSLINKAGYSTLYKYDIRSAVFTPLFSAGDTNGAIVEARKQPKGNLTAFLNRRQGALGAVVRIFDNATKKVYSLPSDTSTPLKEGLSWSPNGTLLAYATLSKVAAYGQALPLSPDSWGVFVSDLLSKKIAVDKGVSPVFISGSLLLFLKKDGLYTTSTGVLAPSQKVWDIPTATGNSNMSLAVSDDRKLVALSSPAESKVFIFKVINVFQLTLSKTIPVVAYSPVFSPHGKYLALHEIIPASSLSGTSTERAEPGASLVLYNLVSLNKKVLFNLPLLPSMGSVSDWQNN